MEQVVANTATSRPNLAQARGFSSKQKGASRLSEPFSPRRALDRGTARFQQVLAQVKASRLSETFAHSKMHLVT